MVEGKHYVYIVYLDTPEGEEMPLWVGQGTSYRWKAYRKRNFKNKDLRAMVEWCRENNLFDQLRPEKVQYFATRDGALDLEEELIALIGRRDLGTGPLFNRTCGGEEGLSETGRMGGRASDGAGSRTRWANMSPDERSESMRVASAAAAARTEECQHCGRLFGKANIKRHLRACLYRPGA